MIAYHCDINAISQDSFATRSEKNRIVDYNSIIKRLADKGHKVEIQILYNEASTECKRFITENGRHNIN